MGMHIQVLLRDRMRAKDYFYRISFLEEFYKGFQVWTGWVTDHEPGGQMNDLGTITDHFLSCVFNIASGAAITGCISNQLKV